MTWYGQTPYEWYAFSDRGIHFFSPYGWGHWLMLGGSLLLPQLFWFIKFRKSIGFTFFVILVLNLGTWFERLVIYLTSVYGDYLPSSWSTDGDNGYFFQLLLSLFSFIVISAPVYWLLNKRKKLPFPSVLLSYSLFFIPYSLSHCTHPFN